MNAGRFSEKIVFVTGAASGIGKEIARQFLDEGATVVGGDISEENLAIVQAEFGEQFTPALVKTTLKMPSA